MNESNKKQSLHLIYPHGSTISTPDAIGRNLAQRFEHNYIVHLHDWDERGRIKPNEGDLLIGHAHPNPLTKFRMSMKDPGWGQKILLQPFTTYPEHVAYLEHVVGHVDKFAAICGKYWRADLKAGRYSSWAEGFYQVELAVDRAHFPRIKRSYGNPGERRFLYIGNADKCKNMEYLYELASIVGKCKFGTIGAYPLQDILHHGRLDFSDPHQREVLKRYDFLIMTSWADANPTVVLEAMSWGLLPICTPQCGYTEEDGVIILAQGDRQKACDILNNFDRCSTDEIESRVNKFDDLLDTEFSWDRFATRIQEIMDSSRTYSRPPKPRLGEVINEVKSNKFFLRPANIRSYLARNR
jgi:glycosyltransferase involved in cell wall biosynthesis